MSYSIGDTKEWKQWAVDPSDVYVWRSAITGATISSPDDASRMLRAVAKSAIDLELDVRAILMSTVGAESFVDVVFTADSFSPLVLADSASDVAEGAMKDSDLRSRFPSISLAPSQFLQLTGPPDALDFWKSHAIVWDDKVGPLQAFAKGDGVYIGTSDDGPRAIPWKDDPPPLNPPEVSSGMTGLLGLLAIAGIIVVWSGTRSSNPSSSSGIFGETRKRTK